MGWFGRVGNSLGLVEKIQVLRGLSRFQTGIPGKPGSTGIFNDNIVLN